MGNGILYLLGLAILLIMAYAFTKAKHPMLTALKSSAGGVAGLLFVNLTSAATGCYIAVNFFTVFVASVLSLPGVIVMLFLNVLFR